MDLTVNTIKEEPSGQHGNRENDDLFEDIDIDMFTTTGLTEADFSFFDEPDNPGQTEPTATDPEWKMENLAPLEDSNIPMESEPEMKEYTSEKKVDHTELPLQAMEVEQEAGKPLLSPGQYTSTIISQFYSRIYTRRHHDERFHNKR